MLLKISLLIAVIAGLGVAGLNIGLIKGKIDTLKEDRDTKTKERDEARTSLAKTTKELKDTKTELATTKDNLKTTTEAKDTAEAQVADLTKKNEGLADNLKKTQEKLSATSDKLASWDAFGITPDVMKKKLDAINAVTAQRDTFATENRVLVGKVANLTAKINDLINPDTDGPQMPAGLKGKILVADPKYDFVVLDIGQKQGVVDAGRFLVNRNGKLVAKLKVQTVEANRCIANVMPGWKLGDVFEGDQVIY